jgi:hypothetical protein
VNPITENLPLPYLDQVCLAVYDLLHQDQDMRDRFGGRTLTGTASIDPDGTTLTGTGTSWATGDDSLTPGDELILGAQIAEVDTVTSDLLLDIVPPPGATSSPGHADGLVDAEIHKAARGYRAKLPYVPINRAPPYWTVAPGVQPEDTRAIGEFDSAPTVQVTMIYPVGAEGNLLKSGEPSWAALTQHVVGILRADSKSLLLQVPRFANPSGTVPGLINSLISADSNLTAIEDPNETIVAAPAVILSYAGFDPDTTSAGFPQRW